MDEQDEDELRDTCDAGQVAIMCAVAAVMARACRSRDFTEAAEAIAGLRNGVERMTDALARRIDRLVQALFSGAADEIDEWAAPFFEFQGVPQVSAADDMEAGHALRAGSGSARAKVRDIVRTSVIGVQTPTGSVVPMAQGYRQTVEWAARQVLSGAMDYEEALKMATGRMGAYGLKVLYESGARRDLSSAVTMNVMDAFNLATDAARMAEGRRFGADGVEVTAHGTCAPDHLPYQGRRFTTERFRQVQASLSRRIADGKNCRHRVYPVVLAASADTYTAGQRKEMREHSTQMVTFGGRAMTRYEASQEQRAWETRLRKRLILADVRDAAGLDTSADRAAVDAQVRAYRAESRRCGLAPREDRITAYERVRYNKA